VFLKENEDLLPCQGFEVNLETENSGRMIELSVYNALLYLRGMAEGPDYIGVEA